MVSIIVVESPGFVSTWGLFSLKNIITLLSTLTDFNNQLGLATLVCDIQDDGLR